MLNLPPLKLPGGLTLKYHIADSKHISISMDAAKFPIPNRNYRGYDKIQWRSRQCTGTSFLLDEDQLADAIGFLFIMYNMLIRGF